MFPNHLFLSVGRSQVPGVRGGNRRVSPSTGLSDFWLPQRDEKINCDFIFVALEKRDFNVDWKISTEQMVYWNSRGSSCELISTQSPLICTSSGMIIGRSSLLIHHDVDIILYYVHLYIYIYMIFILIYINHISHIFFILRVDWPLVTTRALFWYGLFFPQTIYKDFLSWTTTLIA